MIHHGMEMRPLFTEGGDLYGHQCRVCPAVVLSELWDGLDNYDGLHGDERRTEGWRLFMKRRIEQRTAQRCRARDLAR